MKKVSETLKIQIKGILQDCKIICHSSNAGLESDSDDLKKLLYLIQNKSLRFHQNDGCDSKISRSNPTTSEENKKDVPKKRGRRTKISTLSSEPKSRSDSSDNRSLNDSTASTSSTKSRRAAAQVAEQKMAQVQTLVQLKTKLRRPTNFDEKLVNVASSPPTKCRRTHRNQSAGSSSSQTDEANNRGVGEASKNVLITDNENLKDDCLNTGCLVSLTKLNTPTIKSHTHPSCRTSRSLDRTTHRNSEDLFSNPLSELHSKHNESKSDPTHKTNRKKIKKRDLDSGISSTEDELRYLMKPHLPVAQSSPILLQPTDCEFKGFEEDHRQAALVRENTFIVGIKSEETQVLLKKTLKEENQEGSSEEIEQIESSVIKTRTKVLRKKVNNTTINVEEKENVNRNNETHIITKENSSNLCSENKLLVKAEDDSIDEDSNHSNSEENVESQQSSPETNVRSRTKTIRKHKEQHQDMESGSEVEGQSIRTRTKTINKDNKNEVQSDSTDNESSNARSRTKTIKKGPNNKIDELNSEKLISECKDNLPTSKVNLIPPLSPAPAKGELVKKRVEDFEKMQNGIEECEEEKNVGRVTRNAMKSKATASATETQSSKNMRNVPLSKPPTTAERLRMTPLGVNNRMTPSSDSATKLQTNKWASSVNRPTPVENNNVALIHKQPTEEAERKKREEERQKRQAKEEEAKKKKEKVLKATAEEARRKRIEKLQKVAATREAAEKEKERLAAKAEKEKEEKMRQIAAEKEKQKEEQLKKKQLMLQKTLEHEERRKQEEAARLAKLKEQEEEHKRQKAIKEREQELQKQQKTELRLAEAEKNKQHGGKLGKIAAINNAKLKTQTQHGMTPSEKTNGAQASNCYEITPAREDRPLLPPKTETDYGIDDALSEDSSEDESQPRKMIPAWAQSKNRERLLQVNRYIPKKLWDLFMEGDPCPDINKIFAGNPIKRRIRTSSAVWRTPPKYSRVAP